MNFRTVVDILPLAQKIGYGHKMLLVGSCFATNIAEKLQGLKFAAISNPFGVLYNPVSIAQSLQIMAEKRLLTESDLHFENGLWYSYTHHSKFSSPDREQCLQHINTSILKGAWGLRTADYLIVTLGTAWAYRLNKTNEVVANCHKTPEREFERFILSPKEIADTLCEMINVVRSKNPHIKIVFTVSPIRHWKDGAHGNQLSKASLLLGLETLLQETQDTSYFPAYEIMMDELRDYRFYADDMLHPSSMAIDYIWEKFVGSNISQNAQKTILEVKTLLAAKLHKPFNPNTAEHKAFLQAYLQKTLQLKQEYSHLDWDEEEKYFSAQA